MISKWLPEEKVFQLDEPSDALNILRRAGSQKQRNVSYTTKRAHLLAEEFKFQDDEVYKFVFILNAKQILKC